MNQNDTILIQDLTETYTRQLTLYKELKEAVQKLLSRLVLSRGDLSILSGGFEKKNSLLEKIAREREQNTSIIEKWQERKKNIPADEVAGFNEILDRTQAAIRSFLDEEDKLKKYLERIMRKGPDSNDEPRSG